MKINRQKFLNVLNTVICGAHKKEVLEQSHCFIFKGDRIISFNGEIYASAIFPSTEPKDFAVQAYDLIQLVAKFPDEEITLAIKNNQLMISGKKKRAGLTIQKEILLPVEDIPQPNKKIRIKEGVMEALIMAAKVCISSHEDYRVSHVQISPNKIQATDKNRFLRITIKTGLKTILVPSGAILAVKDIPIDRISLGKGWLFIGNKNVQLGICCTEEEYYEEELLDTIINMDDPQPIQLPKEMSNVIDRALIMSADDNSSMSKVSITSKSITVRTQKESGWYEERQPVKYKGEDMILSVGLPLLKDLLSKTHKALVTQHKIKMEKDGIEFVTALGK